MTTDELNAIINNSEFSDLIKEAAPFRVKIIKDYTPQMKEIQNEFLGLMVEANYKDVSNILAKLKLDKKDELAKIDYAAWKKDVMNVFKCTLKAIHPNEGQTPSIGIVYVAGKMLNYIGRNDIVDSTLADKNVSMNFKKLEDLYSFFAKDDTKKKMAQLFADADETQGLICNASDEIKKNCYDQLPPEVKYDSKGNKKGIKQANFCALVRHKAMSVIKDSDKYTKYISAQIDGINANIDREEVVLGKTKQM